MTTSRFAHTGRSCLPSRVESIARGLLRVKIDFNNCESIAFNLYLRRATAPVTFSGNTRNV